jgi:predicted sugar kinase
MPVAAVEEAVCPVYQEVWVVLVVVEREVKQVQDQEQELMELTPLVVEEVEGGVRIQEVLMLALLVPVVQAS